MPETLTPHSKITPGEHFRHLPFADPVPAVELTAAGGPRFPGPPEQQRIEPQPRRLDPLAGGTPNGSAPPYRVLMPARDATPGQIPAGAAVLAAAAAAHGQRVRVTYALAEERATGRMVHSCAVRVAGLGYAVWIDNLYSSAWPNVNQAQFLALATGAQYVPPEPRTPPPTGPCPRCGRPVRWKLTPRAEPYKHQRDLGGEGGRGQRVPCE